MMKNDNNINVDTTHYLKLLEKEEILKDRGIFRLDENQEE